MSNPIFWLFGNTGAGKTTLGKTMAAKLDAFHLDGDDMQRELSMFDMSPQGRRDRCLITAVRAKNLAGLRPVVVSMITPYEDLRQEIRAITGAFFIYLPYGAPASTKNPFELPVLEHLVYQRGVEKPSAAGDWWWDRLAYKWVNKSVPQPKPRDIYTPEDCVKICRGSYIPPKNQIPPPPKSSHE